MKTVSALDLRARVGQLLDEAAAGERIVIERAGQPLCALVPLSDLEHTDPDLVRKRRRRRSTTSVVCNPVPDAQ